MTAQQHQCLYLMHCATIAGMLVSGDLVRLSPKAEGISMTAIRIEFDVAEIIRRHPQLVRGIKKIAAQSVNRSIKRAATHYERELAQKIGLQKRVFTGSRSFTKRASATSGFLAFIEYRFPTLWLEQFPYRISGPKGQKTLKVNFGSRRQEIKLAFLGKGDKIGGQLWRRRGAPKRPIRRLRGPTPANYTKTLQETNVTARAWVITEIERRLVLLLSGNQ